jgi:hypothetical protein
MNYSRKSFLVIIALAILLSIGLGSIYSQINLKSAFAQNKIQTSSWKQKEIMITIWNSGQPDSSAYAKIASEKYNTIPVVNSLENLDVAKKSGLKVLFGSSLFNKATLNDPVKRIQLDDLVKKTKSNSAIEGYFIVDEPNTNLFDDCKLLMSYFKRNDPGKLVYINLFPLYASESQLGVSVDKIDTRRLSYPRNIHGIGANNKTVIAYAEYLRQYISIVQPQLISYDHYHLFEKGDTKNYFLNLAMVAHVSKESNIPFLNIIQASQATKDWTLPTEKEIRFQVYTTLAYGGRGISYYIYWGPEAEGGIYRDGKPSPLAKDIAVINAEIKNLSPVLMSLDLQSVYHTKPLPIGTREVPKNHSVQLLSKGEFVVGLFGKGKNTNAFMITNGNYRNKQRAEIKVGIPGKTIQELDRKTGKWTKFASLNNTRLVKLTLEPGDGRLFRMI